MEFNKLVTYKSWNETIKPLPEDFSPDNHFRAMELAESKAPIYLGIFYKEDTRTFEDWMREVKETVK